jgi:hypothetical protein
VIWAAQVLETLAFLDHVNSTGDVRAEKLGVFIGHLVAGNTMMKRVSEGVGFHSHFNGSANACAG